jgi:hypothetical protein
MRLWSFHPRYLDPKGLVALWREALLAQQVLRGVTIGYRSHPQLERFKAHARPEEAIATYLRSIWREARERGYRFDPARIGPGKTTSRVACTEGQLRYEWKHLLGKLKIRDPQRYRALLPVSLPEGHPLFVIIPGDIAAWEVPGRGRHIK